MKCFALELTPVLSKLFLLSNATGALPENGRFQPIFKKRNKALSGNYKLIALVSITAKIMEKRISIKLIMHLET